LWLLAVSKYLGFFLRRHSQVYQYSKVFGHYFGVYLAAQPGAEKSHGRDVEVPRI
jgi:hypothetical protein